MRDKKPIAVRDLVVAATNVRASLARRISVCGSLSEVVSTCTAVIPRSAFAIFMLHAVLIELRDQLLHQPRFVDYTSSLGLAKYVDDLTIIVHGRCHEACADAMHAID